MSTLLWGSLSYILCTSTTQIPTTSGGADDHIVLISQVKNLPSECRLAVTACFIASHQKKIAEILCFSAKLQTKYTHVDNTGN